MTRGAAASDTVAVIGGGWAGLACAVALADAGTAVTVFEAAGTLGGRARRIEYDNVALDNGQHLLLGAYRQTLELIGRVQPDATSESLYARLPLLLAGPGEFALRAPRLPAPLHTLIGLLTARDCTWSERFAVARAFARWRQAKWRCDGNETVASLLAQQPPRMTARLWNPLCLAALNTPPASASAQVFLNVLRDGLAGARADSDLVIPIVDLSRLFPEPAAGYVAARGGSVRMHTMVRSVVPSAAGVAVRVRAPGSPDLEERFRAAVIATAPWQASRLLVEIPATAPIRKLMDGYRYEPICTVNLRFDSRVKLPEPMLQLAGSPGQWVFDRTTPSMTGSQLAVVISADGPYRAQSHDALANAAVFQLRRELRATRLPGLSWARVITERRATFACTPARAQPAAGAIANHLYLAGDHTDPDYPATLEAATRSGVRAATAILSTC